MPKGKRDRSTDHGACNRSPPTCMLHVLSISDHGRFIPLKQIKGSVSDKLQQMYEIRDLRLAQSHDSPYRMQSVCDQIPTSLPDDIECTGYHRECYSRFTSNLHRLRDTTERAAATPRHHSPRRATSSGPAGHIFPPECIFCEQLEIKDSERKTERTEYFSSWRHKDNAWEKIEKRAEKMGLDRLHRQVKSKDLFACEAKHHPTCLHSFQIAFKNYKRGIDRHERVTDTDQARISAAHENALDCVLEHIQKHVVQQNGVVQLCSLRVLYVAELKRNGYENPNYRSEKLLKRLQNDKINDSVNFTKVESDKHDAITFWLVYSSNTTVDNALARAYTLGTADKCQDVALLLRRNIQQAFTESNGLEWPPTADDMELCSENILPPDLIRFLSMVIAGKEDVDTSEKRKRIVFAIGQDLCRAVSEGKWKLPKHMLLCMTVRHLFRSKQLTTILHRLGHSESYDFGLELETALAKAMDKVSTYLTPQIVKGEGNVVFHCEWDNLNKMTTNVHGSNIVNSAGGIMVQEVKPGFESSKVRVLPMIDKSQQRSLKVDTPETLPHLHFTRVGPKFPDDSSFTPPAENDEVHATNMQVYYVWLLSRYIGSSGRQPVPGLGGFTSATGIVPPRKSTVDYFTPINQPITDNTVVRELLKRSEAATAEVGQKWVLNTFDLGVCMKALPIIWRWPDEFANHIVMIGPFHTSMNYIGMLTGHKMRGSGYEEILFEAQLVTSGSLKGVLGGKAYAKALFSMKTVCEAMERLLIERFAEAENVPIANPAALLNLTQSCDRDHLDEALRDPSTVSLIEKYHAYQDKVLHGHLGKTAAFWMSFITHCHLVFMLLHAVKTNNIRLFHKCNGEMAELFFAFDGHNYSRYLTWLEVHLTNMEKTHPGARDLLTKGAIAIARSMIPGALSAVDKTMEETFMRFAKSSGGFTGLYSQFGAYQRWCRTTSARAQFYEKTLEMVDVIDDPDHPKAGRHRELEKAEIRKGEESVQRVLTAVRNFTNPFTISDKDRLYSMASGAPVPMDVETDILRAEDVGKAAKAEFIGRLQSGEPGKFFEPIKRKKLKTMEASNKKVMLTSSQGKVIQYQEQSNLAFLLLVKSQSKDAPLDLEELMKYCLMPVPPSLGTPDGFFSKTNKATILHYLLEDDVPDLPYPKDALFIQDGMALLHMLANLPPTCGDICLQVLDQMVSKKHFLFSTDSYHPESIKAQERLRRGRSEKIILAGPATRKPYDFKVFLANEDNKKQLCQLLLRVWSDPMAVSRLEKTEMAVLIVEGRAYQFTASNGQVEVQELPALYSNQEETDTRVVLYLHHAATLGYKDAVVRTPDTDIFVILLYHVHAIKLTVYLDTGSGKHRQLINLSELAESLSCHDYCATLLGFYVFSGEDCTSAFKGKGKVGPLKKLEKNPRMHNGFMQLGDDWDVKPQVVTQLEEFTCLMYGQSRESSVDVVRAKLLRKMVGEDEKLTSKSKVDLARLPPCHSALKPHIQRVNHRVSLYKRADEAIIEKPKPYDEGQGWMRTVDGVLEPVWSYGHVLPNSLVDLLETSDPEDEDKEDEENEFDFDDFLESEDDRSQ